MPTTPSMPIGRLDASASGVAFSPGAVLAGRYRIVGLLGRGGMGEVYRADDLRLGQPVSLKFLPAALAANPALLERFNVEVRLARQVSHPNVCRVYDIGELDGQSFISMEYVDGEDLATLLRRIGKLPSGKANEVARQMCAGLGAAHEKGVLHRDLKPSNVMIDGDGRVRITDFGLAVPANQAGAGDGSGTPAYMAPEQFGGGPSSVRSDLYSLGLVLYEIYTGERPFTATSIAEWRNRHAHTEPTIPSAVDADIDDAVERAILRCLEKDPSRRPASALQLAAALPGGNPLAEALAAGETPSPEMVAAAGGVGATRVRTAVLLLGGTLALIAGVVVLGRNSSDLGLAPFTKSADVMRERARAILAEVQAPQNPRDSGGWFGRDYSPMLYLSHHAPSTQWRREMRQVGPPVLYFYRQSPRWMQSSSNDGRLGLTDPPHEVSGMAMVVLDGNAALRELRVVPPQVDSTVTTARAEWAPLFREAGLDFATFRPVAPRWLSPEAFDERAEWVGPSPRLPATELRVAAAAYHARPVYFSVRGPWSLPERESERAVTLSSRINAASLPIAALIVMITGVLFARRNIALGRGDRRGALRLGTFAGVCTLAIWIFSAHHVGAFQDEFGHFTGALGAALFLGVFTTVLYLALEPYVRRRVPELLIGWARLVDGRWRDPRVGRDVLLGALAGSVVALGLHVVNALPSWVPFQGQTPVFPSTDALAGGPNLLAYLFSLPNVALLRAIVTFSLFFVLRSVFRNQAIATAALMLTVTFMFFGGENFMLETPNAVLAGIVLGWIASQIGLLASVVAALFFAALATVPLPLDLSLPYATSSGLVIVLLLAVVIYGFRISLGSQQILARALDD